MSNLNDVEVKKKDKVAVVDIDNILWDFARVFYEKLKKINPDIPEPALWNEFYMWWNYNIPHLAARQIVEEIHTNQEMYSPFLDASDFLEFLVFQKNYYVIIASHRDVKHYDSTFRWLRKNRLYFNELFISYDKTVLFESGRLVIDDHPKTLEKAIEKGCIPMGLIYKWNEHINAHLFDSLTDMKKFILMGQ